jgi:hypothetical protein
MHNCSLSAKTDNAICARPLLTIKKKKKETINNNAQLFIVGKNRQRHLRPSVIDN